MRSTWPRGSGQGASENLMCLDPQSKEVAEADLGPAQVYIEKPSETEGVV